MGSSTDIARLSNEDQQVFKILDDYLSAREAGQHPKIEEIVAAHPHLFERLRDCFASILAVEKLTSGLAADTELEDGSSQFPEFEDFRIVRELGRGGMGVVYEAEQLSLSRQVALKVLPLVAIFDQRSLQRFKNEALATAQLEHPNIINIYSVGCESGMHFYSMQLVEGQSLAAVIQSIKKAGKPPSEFDDSLSILKKQTISKKQIQTTDKESESDFSSRRSISGSLSTDGASRHGDYFRMISRIGVQVADALQHAHCMGIVHRDIKPSNLLLDFRGEVLVSDFGLATMQNAADLTVTGDLLGTLKYMSPEQAAGQTELVDHRTDIYSLGATLYELVTCRSLIEGHGRRQILSNILEEKIVLPTKINRLIPRDLETIVMKALSFEKEQRYSTADAMKEDLQRFLSDQPIFAQRPNLLHRSGKWVRRNRWVAVTATIAIFLLMCVSLASSLFIYRGYEKATRAEKELGKQNERLKREISRANTAERELRKQYQTLSETLSAAVVHLENREFGKAIPLLETVLQLNPDSAQCHLWMARANYELFQFERAVYHATACITIQEELSPQELDSLSYEPWEPYFERARSSLPLWAGEPVRFGWPKGRLEQANVDIDWVVKSNPHHIEAQQLSASIKISLSLQQNNVEMTNHAADIAEAILESQPNNREMLEIAMLRLLKLDRSIEFVSRFEEHLPQNGSFAHGNLLLLAAIYYQDKQQHERAFESYGRALRWFLHRVPPYQHQLRHLSNSLIEHFNREAGIQWNPWEKPNLWNRLYGFRVESTELTKSVTDLDPRDVLIAQKNMNNSAGLQLWTPHRINTIPENGVHLFWKPREPEPVLKISIKSSESLPAGSYRLTAYLTQSYDFSIAQFYWNDRPLGDPVDCFQASTRQNGETDFGVVEIRPGANLLTIQLIGQNSKAVAPAAFGIDFVDLWPVGFVQEIDKELQKNNHMQLED